MAVVPVGATEQEEITRVVFSLTTIPKRVGLLKPQLDNLVENQTRPADAVYLAVGPEITALPAWLDLYDTTSRRPGVLRVLRMAADYGPASKLLACLVEGGERGRPGTLVVYGDDDIMYPATLLAHHLSAHRAALAAGGGSVRVAFGSRRISIGEVCRCDSIRAWTAE